MGTDRVGIASTHLRPNSVCCFKLRVEGAVSSNQPVSSNRSPCRISSAAAHSSQPTSGQHASYPRRQDTGYNSQLSMMPLLRPNSRHQLASWGLPDNASDSRTGSIRSEWFTASFYVKSKWLAAQKAVGTEESHPIVRC